MDNEKALSRFIEDLDCLAPVYEYNNRLDYFRLLGISWDEENRHSNILAWLLDPHGSHELGPLVLQEFIGNNYDCDSFTVQREWFNMDILATSDSEKYLLCIENKTGSPEHTNQLNQYRNILQQYYPDYKKQYIYLSPKGKKASDPEHWKAMSYEEVLRIVDKISGKTSNIEAAAFIRQYAQLLRRDIVGDEELKDMCQRIYAKHKTALELIFANRPKNTDIYHVLKQWAKEKDEKGTIQLVVDPSAKCIRFLTKTMSALMPDSDTPDSKWGTKNHYYYEIWAKESTHDFFIQISLSTSNMSSKQRMITDKIMEAKKDVQVFKKGMEYLNPFVTKHQDYYLLSSDDIWMYADKMFDDLRNFEKEVSSSLEEK